MAKFLNILTRFEKAKKEELKKNKQKNIEAAAQQQDVLAPEPTSREKAKIELDKQIAEKLSRMSNTDMEELFNLHQTQLQGKKKGFEPEIVEPMTPLSFIDAAQEPDVERFDNDVEALLETMPTDEIEVLLESEPAISDEELESKVDAFYKGFGEIETEEEDAGSKAQRFKENFGMHFDRFASGAMLESGSRKTKKAFRKVTAWLSIVATIGYIQAAKVPLAFKKLARKFPARPAVTPKRFPSEARQKAIKHLFLNCKKRVKRKERTVSSHMANFINKVDQGNEHLTKQTVKLAIRSKRRINFTREWAEINKKRLLVALIVIMSCSIATVSTLNYFTAYVYAYNGQVLGMVKNQEDVLRILEIVSLQLSREHGAEILIDSERDITFERVISTTVNREIDDMQAVFNRLTYMQDMNVNAYALFIDGRRIAILDTEENAEALLSSFRESFLHFDANTVTQFENISFSEDVDIRQVDTQLGRIDNPTEILERLKTGATAERVHIVQSGETFSGIARLYGMTQAELHAANPDVTPARLSIGQEIILQQAVPLITVETVETATFLDIIPFETIYEDNPNIFRGEQTTRISGVPGEREVTARITRNNGIEVGRVELAERVIIPPSSAVVERGTREPPPVQGTGRLVRPLPRGSYRITSRFGMRWGRMHNGVDMAAPTGTRIGAADGGTVVFAGYRGAMGNLVIIDHGGGIRTYYAHCSRLFVRRGDRVFQGQHIANVGSTGRSTGPHLHFEVHVNGVPRNPLNFI